VLGASFKPNTDDVRDSPAIAVATKLVRAGAQVTIYDPQGMDNAAKALPQAEYAAGLTAAATGADLVCVLTAWDEFRYVDPAVLGEHVAGRRIIDAMNCLDMPLWTAAGWEFRGMGRPI